MVDGITTMKELSMPLLRGYVGSFQAVTKLFSEGLKGSKIHQPRRISLKGLIEAMKTPRNGSIHSNATDHAIM